MIERVFPAEDSILDELLGICESELETVNCPMKVVVQISVAVEEIFVNIAHYAYPDGNGTFTFSMDASEHHVQITFKDSGIEFNPLAKEDPDVTLSAEEREIGGLGIYMVKKSMDIVEYKYEDGMNILMFVKNF